MILAAAFEKVTERIYSRNFALLTLPAYYSFFFFFALFYSSGTLHSLDFFFKRRFYSSVSDNHVSLTPLLSESISRHVLHRSRYNPTCLF